MQDFIYFFGGPRHGDQLPFTEEIDARLRADAQYIPLTGTAQVPDNCRPWVWNQLDGADYSQLMAEP